jgi:hypothetical protein
MACICGTTVPVVYHGVTKSWGSTASGSRLVLCLNCEGLIERTPTNAVLELRRREAAHYGGPLEDIATPWVFPDAYAAITAESTLQSET